MRDMNAEERAALNDLNLGKLDRLAKLLAQETGQLHPLLQRLLCRMIVGDGFSTDFRLEVRRHPDLKPRQSAAEQSLQVRKEMLTALTMAKNGAFMEGMYESAVSATRAELKVSRSTVLEHWRRHKEYYSRGIKNGTIDRKSFPYPAEGGD